MNELSKPYTIHQLIRRKYDNLGSQNLKNLERFKIAYNETELSLYERIMSNENLSEEEQETVCDLFNRILEANSHLKLIQPKLLRAFFKEIISQQIIASGAYPSLVNRSILLNLLIKKFNYYSYLEIGVFHPEENFDFIKCDYKTGVDQNPLRDDILGVTSDEFFNNLSKEQSFDLIFIDGLHHAGQVQKDIANALSHLTLNGTIVCHDMLPENEEMQTVPRQSVRWMGDCWKAWVHYRMFDKELTMHVINADCGIGIIRRGSQKLFKAMEGTSIDFSFFERYRDSLMHIISVSDFYRKLNDGTL